MHMCKKQSHTEGGGLTKGQSAVVPVPSGSPPLSCSLDHHSEEDRGTKEVSLCT